MGSASLSYFHFLIVILLSGVPGKFFNHTFANINCDSLFKCDSIDRGHNELEAPKKIPEELRNDFTMNGLMKIGEWYFNQQYLNKDAMQPVWKKDEVNKWVELARGGKLGGKPFGNYTIEGYRSRRVEHLKLSYK